MSGRGSPSGSRAQVLRRAAAHARALGCRRSSGARSGGDLAPRAHLERTRRRHARVDEGGERDRAGLSTHASAGEAGGQRRRRRQLVPLPIDEPQFRAFVSNLVRDLRATGKTYNLRSYLDSRNAPVSRDRHATLVQLLLGSDSAAKPVEAVVEKANGGAFSASITGDHSVGYDFGKQSQKDLENGELAFGLPAALIVLVLVFGAVVAGLVPVLLAILSILVALGLVALLSLEFTLSVFIVNMLTGMGLALGIDYSLFVVSRYREERALGLAKEDAIAHAGATASRAVLFSGSTFVVALLRHAARPDDDHAQPRRRRDRRRHRLGGRRADAPAGTAQRLRRPGERAARAGDRPEPRTRGRDRGSVLAADRRRRAPPSRALPRGERRRDARGCVADLRPAHRRERRQHAAGQPALQAGLPCAPAVVSRAEPLPGERSSRSAATRPSTRDLVRLERRLAADPRFGPGAVERSRTADAYLLTAPVRGDAVAGPAVAAVRDLRSHIIPSLFRGSGARVYVGGKTAENVDYFDAATNPTPYVLLFVLGLSLVLLTVAFRSIVVALVSIVLNLLSVGAAYGLADARLPPRRRSRPLRLPARARRSTPGCRSSSSPSSSACRWTTRCS